MKIPIFCNSSFLRNIDFENFNFFLESNSNLLNLLILVVIIMLSIIILCKNKRCNCEKDKKTRISKNKPYTRNNSCRSWHKKK